MEVCLIRGLTVLQIRHGLQKEILTQIFEVPEQLAIINWKSANVLSSTFVCWDR